MTRPPIWTCAPDPRHWLDPYTVQLRVWIAGLVVAAGKYPRGMGR